MKFRVVLLILLVALSGAMSSISINQTIEISSHEPLWQVGDSWDFQDYEFNYTQYYLDGSHVFDPILANHHVFEITSFDGIESFRVESELVPGFVFNYYYSTSHFALLGADISFVVGDQMYESKVPYLVNGLPYLNFSDFGEGSHSIDVEIQTIATVTNITNPIENTTSYTDQSQSLIYNISSESITINGYSFDTYRIDSQSLFSTANSTNYENGILVDESKDSTEWFANGTGYIETYYSENYLDNSTYSSVDIVHYNDTVRDDTFWVSKRFGHIVMESTTQTLQESSLINSIETINGTTYYNSLNNITRVPGPNAGISDFNNNYYSLYGDTDAPAHTSSSTSYTSSAPTGTNTSSTITSPPVNSTTTTNTSSTTTSSTETVTNSTETTTNSTTTSSTTESSTNTGTNSTTTANTTSSSTTGSETTASNTTTSDTTISESSTIDSSDESSITVPGDTTKGNETSSSDGDNPTDVTLPISSFVVFISFVAIEILRKKKRSS